MINAAFNMTGASPIEATQALRAAAWEGDTVFDEALGGADDSDVSKFCRAERRVLFTLDLDFADIRAYPPSAYVGIVVSTAQAKPRASTLVVSPVIPVLAAEWVENPLWIVEPGRVRIRTTAAVQQAMEPASFSMVAMKPTLRRRG
jgi:predicted nuclease of predicted toxin-antitoxin system